MSKRRLNRRQNWRIQKIQQERTKRAEAREDRVQEQLQAGELGGEQMGTVIAHYGSQLDIEPADQPDTLYRCHLRANLPPLVTGDRVIWRAGSDLSGVVVAVQERDSELCRPDSRGQLKPVAANIDYIVQVIAPLPTPHPNLIDRYLVAAEAVGIEPVILFNKIDLLNDSNRDHFDQLLDRYQSIGYRVIHASTHSSTGLEEIKGLLKGHTSVFVGQSGVGKSSLINALLPGVDIRVGALSEQTGKGTHTTTAARLFHFPAGGNLIDSPGIREFGLGHIDQATLIEGFREFRPFLGYCRFRDCQHEQEPGCALLEALAEGKISQKRLDSYRHILSGN
ncbi:small ribosomal subunit biogenesis GTPase RsgA [Aestuariirhabdus litorea]|uniref:Small ribosomal subunit biogenesis GTPase RsgA n=1 Tax=Aestuariirhabdus litorea TaxID=2528527 RepID=A0A3P3VLG9_9GAMM|nr:small ribosomal subunit biogenesis GTPase RsgA [Aestuariirhabdus litorea]RRJ83470.1 small ribosomal subunit biogenesis GTPase RsgA [Aestuariirhabdus litorea]RWW93631.1 small ribosomal subunit biogenesis GTPase RsgA [Endozoicomonadaceae bacterium GTF-13]